MCDALGTGGQDVKFTQCKVWHLDVGLSFPKSVGPLIVGSADLLRSDFRKYEM